MFDYVFERLLTAYRCPRPMFRINVRLLELRREKVLNGGESIVIEFELIPRRFPSIDMRNELGIRKGLEAVLYKASIDKGYVVVGGKVTNGEVCLRVHLLGEMPNKPLIVKTVFMREVVEGGDFDLPRPEAVADAEDNPPSGV
jgi:hypothetical protein